MQAIHDTSKWNTALAVLFPGGGTGKRCIFEKEDREEVGLHSWQVHSFHKVQTKLWGLER